MSDFISWWNEDGLQDLGILVFVLLHVLCDQTVSNIALADKKCLNYLLCSEDYTEATYTWDNCPLLSGWMAYKRNNNIQYKYCLSTERMPKKSVSGSKPISGCASRINPEAIRKAKEDCAKRILESQEESKKKRRRIEGNTRASE